YSLVIIQHHLIGQTLLAYKLLRGRNVINGIYAQNDQILACRVLSCIKMLHIRSFHFTARTVGVPEIEQNRLPAIIAQAHPLAVEGGKREVGSGIADMEPHKSLRPIMGSNSRNSR